MRLRLRLRRRVGTLEIIFALFAVRSKRYAMLVFMRTTTATATGRRQRSTQHTRTNTQGLMDDPERARARNGRRSGRSVGRAENKSSRILSSAMCVFVCVACVRVLRACVLLRAFSLCVLCV